MRKPSFEGFDMRSKDIERIQKDTGRRVDEERRTRPEVLDEKMRERQFRWDAQSAADGMTSGDLSRSRRAKR